PSAAPAPIVRLTIVPPESAPFSRLRGDPNLVIAPAGAEIIYTSIAPASAGTSQASFFVKRPVDQFARLPIRIAVAANAGAAGGVDALFISPDGKWLGFIDALTGQVLQRVSIGGGLPFTVARVPLRIYGASWEGDNQIVFGGYGGLFRASTDGREPV